MPIAISSVMSARSVIPKKIFGADVVDLFDVLDPGDPSVPPRFVCEKCGGAMWPA